MDQENKDIATSQTEDTVDTVQTETQGQDVETNAQEFDNLQTATNEPEQPALPRLEAPNEETEQSEKPEDTSFLGFLEGRISALENQVTYQGALLSDMANAIAELQKSQSNDKTLHGSVDALGKIDDLAPVT